MGAPVDGCAISTAARSVQRFVLGSRAVHRLVSAGL